jgi:hypothetical protein
MPHLFGHQTKKETGRHQHPRPASEYIARNEKTHQIADSIHDKDADDKPPRPSSALTQTASPGRRYRSKEQQKYA